MNFKNHLFWIFVIALGMMLGSLYIENFGDPLVNLMHGVLFPVGRGYTPCTLCWYERICMYPMVAILFVYFFKKTKDIVFYLLPFVIIGLGFCIYHALLQRGYIPAPSVCTSSAPCDFPVINYFGWMNLPFFGVICNAIILLLLSSKKHA